MAHTSDEINRGDICDQCSQWYGDDPAPGYPHTCPACRHFTPPKRMKAPMGPRTTLAPARRRDDDRIDYGGVLGADGQIYSDADPGL